MHNMYVPMTFLSVSTKQIMDRYQHTIKLDFFTQRIFVENHSHAACINKWPVKQTSQNKYQNRQKHNKQTNYALTGRNKTARDTQMSIDWLCVKITTISVQICIY